MPAPVIFTATGARATDVTVRESTGDSRPPRSTDLTRMVFGPAGRLSAAVQLLVPLAGSNGPPLTEQKTCATPSLSVARPTKVTTPLVRRALAAGEAMVTVGLAESTN